ncbi:MAG: cysteine desulfurase-like protein [Chloroflexi bacterium]|nr:cysteine desulfurase-like protein [Chloroflexota bacterium]
MEKTTQTQTFDKVRERFPSLHQRINGRSPVYFDNPGGTQVPQSVIDAMVAYLATSNSNKGGAFTTSRRTDATVKGARHAMMDMLNASRPEEIVIGPNMTTLTFHIARSIGQTLNPGDELVVTRMDHDANVAPWLLLARDHNLPVRMVDFNPETGRLNYTQLEAMVNRNTKVIACVYASNALGTINDMPRVVQLARSVGAMTYIDAVQYAPHGPIDVQALDVDFLACSAYKFFGPHLGIVYGKYDLLESLPVYKVRPAPATVPGRWETGTGQFEAMAGLTAAVDYLAWVGDELGTPASDARRDQVQAGMTAIRAYEMGLSQRLLDGLASIPSVTVKGITDEVAERVPTIIFTVDGFTPREAAEALAADEIYVWNGDYYAIAVMELLGMQKSGGMVRVGAAHYNTPDEVDRFLNRVENL